jgi:hypothetical protein
MDRAGRRALEDSRHETAQERPAPAPALPLGVSNHALAALLARDATKPKPNEPEPAEATGSRVVFPDIGTVPIESMQWSGGGRPSGREQNRPSDVTFTSKVGKHSSDLMRQMLQGKAQDLEVFIGGTKFKLKGAMVSSYSTGAGGEQDAMESWTVNFQAIEFEGQKDGDAEPPPDYDRSYPG